MKLGKTITYSSYIKEETSDRLYLFGENFESAVEAFAAAASSSTPNRVRLARVISEVVEVELVEQAVVQTLPRTKDERPRSV